MKLDKFLCFMFLFAFLALTLHKTRQKHAFFRQDNQCSHESRRDECDIGFSNEIYRRIHQQILSKRTEKERSHFRVDCQTPANRNHAKIRNHRRSIARDVTDRLCRFKVKQGVLLMYFIYSTLSLKTRSFTIRCISLKHASLALNQNRLERTNFKQDLQQITCTCSKETSENTSW